MSRLLTLGLLASAATAKVIDSLNSVPKGWERVRDAESDEAISFRIALRQQGESELTRRLIDISTPGNAAYGKHLSRDEVRALTAPSEKSSAGVSAWLADHGIDSTDVDNDWVTVKTTVSQANSLLDTDFAWFRQTAGADTSAKLRALSYSVPDSLVGDVDMVQPTTRFGQLGQQRSTIFETHDIVTPQSKFVAGDDTAAAAQAGLVTPEFLEELYNIKYTASPDGNLAAFASYLNQYARYDDLERFQEQYKPSALGQNFSVELVNGGKNDQDSREGSGEANLDVQYLLGVSAPIPILEYSTGGLGPLVPTEDQPSQPGSNEPYLEFLTHVLKQDDADLPQTLSTSYGEEEQSVPQDYALKVCNLFQQLGARGVSVLFSSGDSGPGNSCVREEDGATFFGSTFPAGCPYVTAVGGTYQTNPERAVSFSSGGFSIYHERPEWQDEVVPAYLELIGDTYAPYFNASGRGIPDVSAQSYNFAVYDKGRLTGLSGTSASCPVFAGVVALLNAARKSQGQSPLGFLNPWLYKNGGALTDITDGAGRGCAGSRDFSSGYAYWNATEGWDPATGLGTPKFEELLEAAAPGVENA